MKFGPATCVRLNPFPQRRRIQRKKEETYRDKQKALQKRQEKPQYSKHQKYDAESKNGNSFYVIFHTNLQISKAQDSLLQENTRHCGQPGCWETKFYFPLVSVWRPSRLLNSTWCRFLKQRTPP